MVKTVGNIYGMGVYCFKDLEGIIKYVGSGMMNDRLQAHLSKLKNNKYKDTNKDILQELYNKDELKFEVLHYSENNSDYINGSKEYKKAVQLGLEVLEQFYYNLYKDTCCNKIGNIHKTSSSPTIEVTLRRRELNSGINNPSNIYSEELIRNILYLKDIFNVRQIKEIIMKEFNINISNNYIYNIGNTKWVNIKPLYSKWMDKYIKVA